MDDYLIGEYLKQFIQDTIREMVRNGEFYIDKFEEGAYGLYNLGE